MVSLPYSFTHSVRMTKFAIFCLISLILNAGTNASTSDSFKNLEVAANGRLGISAIDTATNKTIQYRANERFPMGCTSKVIGVAAILSQSMNDSSLLAKTVNYTKKDLTNWDPITQNNYQNGMTVEALCAASISYSDNAAMNLLVKQLGGLEKINIFARSIHNHSFRQDNGWPEEAMSGGPANLKDTSTPQDMRDSLQQLIFTDTLAKPQQKLLLSWMKNNTTGNARIRAGAPKAWIIGDKTGTGDYGTTNDIGIIWPPKCAPVIVAIYYTSNNQNAVNREDIIASATRIVIDEISKTNPCIHKAIT